MKWFGESWGSPVNEDTEHVPTPVGAICLHCKTSIQEQDRGFLIPYHPTRAVVRDEAWHFRCFMLQIMPEAEYDNLNEDLPDEG